MAMEGEQSRIVQKQENVVYVKTVQKNNIGWVSFSISHSGDWRNSEIERLHSDGLTFSFGQNLFNDDTMSRGWFEPYLDFLVEGDQKKHFATVLTPLVPDWDKVLAPIPPTKKKITEKFFLTVASPAPQHFEMVIDCMTKMEGSMKVPTKESICVETRRKSSNLPDPRISFTTNIVDNVLSIPGHNLFFDKTFWSQGKANVSKVVFYEGVWVTTNVLTNSQRALFNPIGVFVKHLNNLPPQICEIQNLRSLELRYSLGTMIPEVVIPIEIAENPTKNILNHVRTFLTKNLSRREMLDAFNCDPLFIKVYGLMEKVEESTRAFGSKWGDERLADRVLTRPAPEVPVILSESSPSLKVSKKSKPEKKRQETFKKRKKSLWEVTGEKESTRVLLGVARVDCSNFLFGDFRIDARERLLCGDSYQENLMSSSSNGSIYRRINVMDINYAASTPSSALSDLDFLTNDTHVSVTVTLGFTLRMSPRVAMLADNDVYGRIVAVIYEASHAKEILKDIYIWNTPYGDPKCKIPFVPYHLAQNCYADTSSQRSNSNQVESKREKALTGFMVDFSNYYILMVEGLANISLQNVLTHFQKFQSENGILMYNSELTFNKRIYGDFIPAGGVKLIVLVQTLESILSKPKICLQGQIPVPALRALMSLERLKTNLTLRQAIKDRLFPTVQELLSLDLEFGLPVGATFSDTQQEFYIPNE